MMRLRRHTIGLAAAVFAVIALAAATASAAAPSVKMRTAQRISAHKAHSLADHRGLHLAKGRQCKRGSQQRIDCVAFIRGHQHGRSVVCRQHVILLADSGRRGQRVVTHTRCQRHGAGQSPVTPKVKLHAHLDPTYTRDPLNPFKVTYEYSASATQEAAAASASAEEPAPLPSGVLALYSDGTLECAINVGGSVVGNECPVNYKALGEHKVTTIYSSGEQSATETEVENIEPLPTSTSLTVTYEPLATTLSNFGCGDGSACSQEAGITDLGGFEIGALTVHGNAQPWGSTPLSACESGDSFCEELILDSNGSATFAVFATAEYTVLETKDLAPGETLAIEAEPAQSVGIQGLGEFPAADIEAGTYRFRVASPPQPGYSNSIASASVRFTPEVTSPVERIPCGC